MGYGKLSVLETTFRDGLQSETIDSVGLRDSLGAIKLLDSLGFEYLELGFAVSNRGDRERLQESLKLGLRSKVAAFGRTVCSDAEAVLALGVAVGVLVGKSRLSDVRNALNKTADGYLREVEQSIRLLVEAGCEVIFDAEHFFQAIAEDDDVFAMSLLQTVFSSGASWLVLCDTNGKLATGNVEKSIHWAGKYVPSERIGVHFHNDRGRALANAEAAWGAGIRHFQGVFGGFGERAGNLDLSTLLPNLVLDSGCVDVSPEVLRRFAPTYYSLCATLGISPDNHRPYVGKSVFYTEAGMHGSGELKDAGSYLHADPKLVGNEVRFGVTELSGRANLVIKARELGVDLPPDCLPRLAKEYKRLSDRGVSFGRAEASFHLWLLRELGRFSSPFEFLDWRIIDERLPGHKAKSEASLRMKIGQEETLFNARGDGPVNALEKVLRRSLGDDFPALESVRLVDFSLKTVDMQKGSAAVVRIRCDFSDGGRSWTTIGVREDFIDAAWEALLDGYLYKIFLSRA